MPTVNAEVRKVVRQLRGFQKQVQNLVKNKGLVDDARKFAEKQGKELRKLITADAHKVMEFVERQRSEIEDMQKRIPSEITKIRKYVDSQKREFERVVKNLNASSALRAAGVVSGSQKRAKTGSRTRVKTGAKSAAKTTRVQSTASTSARSASKGTKKTAGTANATAKKSSRAMAAAPMVETRGSAGTTSGQVTLPSAEA